MLEWLLVLTQIVDLPESYLGPSHKNPLSSKFSPFNIFLLTYSQSFPRNSFLCLGSLLVLNLLLHDYQHSECLCSQCIFSTSFSLFRWSRHWRWLVQEVYCSSKHSNWDTISLSSVFKTSLLTTDIGNTFFRRTGDGMSPSFLTCCHLLRTLLTHFGLFSV